MEGGEGKAQGWKEGRERNRSGRKGGKGTGVEGGEIKAQGLGGG